VFRNAIADALADAMTDASGAQVAALVREAGLECLRRHVGTANAEVRVVVCCGKYSHAGWRTALSC
jgi:hypothetical protein